MDFLHCYREFEFDICTGVAEASGEFIFREFIAEAPSVVHLLLSVLLSIEVQG